MTGSNTPFLNLKEFDFTSQADLPGMVLVTILSLEITKKGAHLIDGSEMINISVVYTYNQCAFKR